MEIREEDGDDAASIITVLPAYGEVNTTRPLRPGSPTPSYRTVDPTTTVPVRTRVRNPLKRIFSRSSRRAPNIPTPQDLSPRPSPATSLRPSPAARSFNTTPRSAQALVDSAQTAEDLGNPPTNIHEAIRLGKPSELRRVLWETRPRHDEICHGMFVAITNNYTQMLRILMEYTGNSSSLNPPAGKLLNVAISEHADESLHWLLCNGVAIRDTNEYDRTAVHVAAIHGGGSLVELLECGGKRLIDHPDRLGNTALHLAAALGFSVNVIILLRYGANINAANNKGQTPLHLAAENCLSLTCVEFLISRRADLSCLTKLNESPLHLAFCLNDKECRNSRMNDVRRSVVITLINASPRGIVSLRNNKGLTPLHLAIALQDLACVQKLVNVGADVEARTPEGHSPLQLNAYFSDKTQDSAIADCLTMAQAAAFERASIGQSSSAP